MLQKSTWWLSFEMPAEYGSPDRHLNTWPSSLDRASSHRPLLDSGPRRPRRPAMAERIKGASASCAARWPALRVSSLHFCSTLKLPSIRVRGQGGCLSHRLGLCCTLGDPVINQCTTQSWQCSACWSPSDRTSEKYRSCRQVWMFHALPVTPELQKNQGIPLPVTRLPLDLEMQTPRVANISAISSSRSCGW